MIEVTQAAANKFRTLMEKKNLEPTAVVRFSLKGGGCSGFSYVMDFQAEPEENDKVFEKHGVRFAVDVKSFLFMSGTTVDYADDLMESGFKFNNPNATGACGCGKSVSF